VINGPKYVLKLLTFLCINTMTSSFNQDMALKEAMQDQQFIDSDIFDDCEESMRETEPEDWTPEELCADLELEGRY